MIFFDSSSKEIDNKEEFKRKNRLSRMDVKQGSCWAGQQEWGQSRMGATQTYRASPEERSPCLRRLLEGQGTASRAQHIHLHLLAGRHLVGGWATSGGSVDLEDEGKVLPVWLQEPRGHRGHSGCVSRRDSGSKGVRSWEGSPRRQQRPRLKHLGLCHPRMESWLNQHVRVSLFLSPLRFQVNRYFQRKRQDTR